MSASTPRTLSNAPDLRQLLAAVGALILAVALLVIVTFSRQASFQAATSVAEAAPVAFDHGWAEAAQSATFPAINSSTGFVMPKATQLTVAYPAIKAMENAGVGSISSSGVVATENGGILYTGIPYTAPVAEEPAYIGYPSLGRELIVRTENGGLRYTGIPYPAPDANAPEGLRGRQMAQ